MAQACGSHTTAAPHGRAPSIHVVVYRRPRITVGEEEKTETSTTSPTRVKDRYGEPEGGSEWEPIKILLEGDGDSNKTNTTSNTRLRLTTQVGQVHAVTEVVLDLGTNKQPPEPKHTNTHSGNLHGLLPMLHRSDEWPAPVKPVVTAAAQQAF
jgi:hypothetical protein